MIVSLHNLFLQGARLLESDHRENTPLFQSQNGFVFKHLNSILNQNSKSFNTFTQKLSLTLKLAFYQLNPFQDHLSNLPFLTLDVANSVENSHASTS